MRFRTMRYIETALLAEETKRMRERPSGQATLDFTPVDQKTVDRVEALQRPREGTHP